MNPWVLVLICFAAVIVAKVLDTFVVPIARQVLALIVAVIGAFVVFTVSRFVCWIGHSINRLGWWLEDRQSWFERLVGRIES